MGKVVVVGSINVDLVFVSNKRPKAGETVLGESYNVIPGGKGANQAVAASLLGAKSFMVGCIGNDSNGEFSLKNFQEKNVDTTCIQTIQNVPTGVANIVVAENDNSIIVISGANYKLSKSTIDISKKTILSADIVLLQLEIPIDVVEYVIDICKENNIKTILNPAPAMKLDEKIIKNATFITPNEHELKVIFGEDISEDHVLRKYPDKLIVTKGSRGVKFFNRHEIVNVPSYKINVVDTTGAGDTFCGSLAAALVKEYTLEQAINFANKAAAISTTKLGAQSGMPRLEELEQFRFS